MDRHKWNLESFNNVGVLPTGNKKCITDACTVVHFHHVGPF